MEIIANHDYSSSYALPERNGTYEIVFKNTHPTKTLNFSLSLNSRDMLLIPFSHRIEHALTPTSINYYELIAPANGFVTLDMVHCAG